MSCAYQDKLKDYLEENLSDQEMQSLEKHLDSCQECQQQLDDLLSQPLDMPSQPVEVDDEVLIGRIKARSKGIKRITIFGILGFFLGVFSHVYILDTFIITKAIMALPYKLAELVLGIFFTQSTASFYFDGDMGFFPFNQSLELAATLITPGFIAAFIAIMIGYLVSDQRVFTRKKIVNFIVAGIVALSVWIAILYGAYTYYAYTTAKIDNLEGIKCIEISSPDHITSKVMRINEDAFLQPKYADFIAALEKAKMTGKSKSSYSRQENDYGLEIDFAGGSSMYAYISVQSQEMVMENGNIYQLFPGTTEQLIYILGVKSND